MSNETDFYSSHHWGNRLEHGEKLKLEHTVYYSSEHAASPLKAFTSLPVEKLQALKEISTSKENEIYEQLKQSAKAWEKQAANTLLIDKAIEYLNTPAPAHTSNKWVTDESGASKISNMVYCFSFHVREDTVYDRKLEKSIPIAWDIYWSVYTNYVRQPYKSGHKIAGQDKKRFTSNEAAEKYMNGRFVAYAHLFTEISPPVPKEYVKDFCVNGLLLPGYAIDGLEPSRTLYAAPTAESIVAENGYTWQTKQKSIESQRPKRRSSLQR